MFVRRLFWTHFRVTKLRTLTSQYVAISHSRFGLQPCDIYKFAKDNLTFIIHYSKKAVCSLSFARTDLHIYISLLFNIFLTFEYYIYWGVCNYNKQLPKWSEFNIGVGNNTIGDGYFGPTKIYWVIAPTNFHLPSHSDTNCSDSGNAHNISIDI